MVAKINKNGVEINNSKKNYLRTKLIALDEFKQSSKYIGGLSKSTDNSLDLIVLNIKSGVEKEDFDNIVESDFYELRYESTVIMKGYSLQWVTERRKNLITDILSDEA